MVAVLIKQGIHGVMLEWASSITGGKASAVDYKILLENCSKKSKALRLAKRARNKYNKGRRKVKQVKIGGGKRKKKANERDYC